MGFGGILNKMSIDNFYNNTHFPDLKALIYFMRMFQTLKGGMLCLWLTEWKEKSCVSCGGSGKCCYNILNNSSSISDFFPTMRK